MALFSGLMGNAAQMDSGKASDKLEAVLIPGETVQLAYQMVRDYVVFTTHRLIVVDVQGVGKKQAFKSVPYGAISRFSVELAGNFDLDSELDIYISSSTQPVVTLSFKGSDAVVAVQQALAMAVLS